MFLLEDQAAVGGMDDAIVDFLESFRLEESRLRLNTPDLAAASKLVADKYQHRLARLGLRDACHGGCAGHHQATHHQGPSLEHQDVSRGPIPRDQYGRLSHRRIDDLTAL